MILIPSDEWFANNVDFSKNEKLSRIFKILLKWSFQFKFRQLFKRNLSKSFQGKCVDHLSSFKCFIWPYLFEFLRFEMGKNRRFHSWINKSWFLTEKNYWSDIFRPQYLQMYYFEVIRPWNGEKWIFQTRKLKPRNWVWEGFFICNLKMRISRPLVRRFGPEIFLIRQSCGKGKFWCLC